MFDVGFFELVLLAVVALLVLGPERLPHAVRMTGALLGKVRRTVFDIRAEFEREVDLKEMQDRVKAQAEESGVPQLARTLAESGKEIEQQTQAVFRPAARAPAKQDTLPDTPQAADRGGDSAQQ